MAELIKIAEVRGRPGPRNFLFLQGPPGPLFRTLGQRMAAAGIGVHRINLNGGDLRDWPTCATNYRGTLSRWPSFVDSFMRQHDITDLILFGDCRQYHRIAHGVAGLRGVRVHVMEEGYLRPNWMTLEPQGVNGHSGLPRDIQWFLAEAEQLPDDPAELPSVTAAFRRRAHDSYWYYHRVFTDRWRYPFYRNHRRHSILAEGFGWLNKFIWQGRNQRRADVVTAKLDDGNFFIFPLQLSGDFQIRTHSPFPDMQSACRYVIDSFAKHAPTGSRLVVKAHPLDSSFFPWRGFINRLARRRGLQDRVDFIDGGDLDDLSLRARGMVCVNSTSATLALMNGTPVCALGDAVYDMAGLTYQRRLDQFWHEPTPPLPGAYEAFRKVLVHRTLVRGGLASQSAVAMLTDSILERLGIGPVELGQKPVDQSEVFGPAGR